MTPELYVLLGIVITTIVAPLAAMFWNRFFGKRDGATQAAENLSTLAGNLSEQLANSEKEKQIIIGQKDAIIAHLNTQLVEALQANTRMYSLSGTVRAGPLGVEFHEIKTQPVHEHPIERTE